MGQETLICPHCRYENIVLTCGFCLQCGEDIAAPTMSAQLPSSANSAASPTIGGIAPALSHLMALASEKLQAPCTETERGWRITLPVGGGRKQTVHVLRSNDDESTELIAFLSLCGPVQEDLALKLLEWNSRLTNCAFAVRAINGERMFVLNANLPVHAISSSLVIDALTTIAHRGDYVERRLSGGADRF